jgi:hypothetical protein
MNPTLAPKRQPRFKRVTPPNFRFTDRDREMIRQVAKHRFLNSDHLFALTGDGHNRKKILARLYLLFHAGYLDRPTEQIKPYKSGSDPMVYALTNQGAKTIGWPGRFDWNRKNQNAKYQYLDHSLNIANFMVSLELALKASSIRLVEELEITAGLGQTEQAKFKLKTQIPMGSKRKITFSLIPDKLFALEYPGASGSKQDYFLLEADQGTMKLKRRNFYQTSIYKKMLGYWNAHQSGVFRKRGLNNIRVLFITSSPERVNNMIQVGKEVDGRGKGTRLFYFALSSQFSPQAPKNSLKSVWQNGRDDKILSVLD